MPYHWNGKNAFPRGEHWAIVSSRTITIPGDERSRQAPGHGYPESHEEIVSYEVFLDEKTFMDAFNHSLQRQGHHQLEHLRGIHVTDVFIPVIRIEAQKS